MGCHAGPYPFDSLLKQGGGLGVQLLPEHRLMTLSGTESARPITSGGNGLHVGCGHSAVERVRLSELLPAPRRHSVVAPSCSHVGELLQSAGVLACELATLQFHPPFELGRPAQEKAIEERTGVRGHGVLQIARRKCGAEHIEVAGEYSAVKPQLGRAYKKIGRPEIVSETVKELSQAVSGALHGRFGPEQGQQLIATHASRASAREKCEQRKSLALCSGRAERLASALQGDAAKRAEL